MSPPAFNATYAVRPVKGKAAASAKVILFGLVVTLLTGTTVNSARVPRPVFVLRDGASAKVEQVDVYDAHDLSRYDPKDLISKREPGPVELPAGDDARKIKLGSGGLDVTERDREETHQLPANGYREI